MSTNRTFFHVLIIGSASTRSSAGQIPEPENIIDFQTNHKDKLVYLYFIDPAHLTNANDELQFATFSELQIPHSTVYQKFDPTTFGQVYKIFPEDELLVIDYAALGTCEQDWIEMLGARKNWWYWCPGCVGSRLDLEQAWNLAHNWTPYNLYSNFPAPFDLSKAHREKLLTEVNRLALYFRLLPENSTDPDPPEWLIKQDKLIEDNNREGWTGIRLSASETLEQFFRVNKIDFWIMKSTDLYARARRVLYNT